MAEHMICFGLKKKINALGHNFDKVSRNIEIQSKVEVKTQPAFIDMGQHVGANESIAPPGGRKP